jgi:alcohol dehydrogenase (NADP+)
MHWPVAWQRGEDLFPKKDGQIILDESIDLLDVLIPHPIILTHTYLKQTYRAMEKLLSTGKTKAIGVSNCSKPEMERIVKEASVVPAVHQMECHPWLQQEEFTAWHKAHGIHVTHYSPLGNQNALYGDKGLGKLIDEPLLAEIGKKYGKSAAQVALGKIFSFSLPNGGVMVGFADKLLSSMGCYSGPFGASEVEDALAD